MDGLTGLLIPEGDAPQPRAGARFDLVQHLFTLTPGLAPPAHTLLVGELGLELANPPKIWAGVPTDIDPSGRKLLYNSEWVFFPEAPTDGVVYGRQGSSTSWKGVLPLTAGITNKLTDALYIDSTSTGLAAAIHLTTPGWPAVVWNTTSADTAAGYFESRRYGLSRWSVEFGGSEAETGYDDGTNFLINRFDDTGTVLYPSPLQIIRADGSINIGTPLTVYANTNISGDLDVIGTPGADGSGGAWLAVHGSEILGRGGDAELSAGASIEPGSGGNLQLAAGEGFGAGQRGGFLLLSAGFGADGAVSGPIVLDTNNTSSGIGSLSPGAYVYGPLTLDADPTAPLQVATKQYVDSVRSLVTGGYLPLSGGTLTGNMAIAPTGSAILNLIKTGGSTNVNVIAGLTSGVLRWGMQLGNGNPESGSSAGSDFALYNYDDAGAYIGNPLFINRATGIVTLPNGLIVYSSITAGLPTGGKAKLNPGDAGHTGYVAFHNASDVRQAYFGYASGGSLFLQLEDATTNFQISAYTVRLAQGRLISQGNAINPSLAVFDNGTAVASGMWIEPSGNLVWGDTDGNGVPTVTRMWLDRGSNFWANGSIHAGGALVASGDVSAGSRVYCSDSMNYSGTFYVAGNYNYSMGRNSSTAIWNIVDNARPIMSVDPSGNFAVLGAITGAEGYLGGRGIVYPNINTFGFNFRWDGLYIFGRVDNAVEYPLANASDERRKQDIAPSKFDCLAAVMATPLFEYRWRDGIDPTKMFTAEARDDAPLVPVGFVAQRQHEAFPASVIKGDDEIGKGAEGATQLWSMDHNVLCAALFGALQQLAERVAALEAAAH